MDWDKINEELAKLESEEEKRAYMKEVVNGIIDESERRHDFKGTNVNENKLAQLNAANALASMIFSDKDKYKINFMAPTPRYSSAGGSIEVLPDDLDRTNIAFMTKGDVAMFSAFLDTVDGINIETELGVDGKLKTLIGYDIDNVYRK